MEKLGGVVQSKGGRAIAGVTVQVFIAGTNTLAQIYSNRQGSQPITTLKTDNEGEWGCYAANGRYDVFTLIGGQRDGQYLDYLLYDPEDDQSNSGSTALENTVRQVIADVDNVKTNVNSLNLSITSNAASITELKAGAKDFDTTDGASIVWGNFPAGPATLQDLAEPEGAYMIGRGASNDGSLKTVGASLDAIEKPASSVVPETNGQLVIEATSNTTLTLKLKGTDGTVRSVTLTLA